MASLISLSLPSLFLFLSLSCSSASTHNHHPLPYPIKPKLLINQPEIVRACKSTRFPDTCASSLSDYNHVPPNPTPLQIIQSAVSLSSTNLETAQSMVRSILDSSAGSINRTSAAQNCIEVLNGSHYRISSTDGALARGRTKDARAWMSAALLYQYDCWSALKYANDTSQTSETMSFLVTLMNYTGNALSMIVSYDNFGNETGSWMPPKTERDGFWEGAGSSAELALGEGLLSDFKPDVTVCKDGSNGCYKTVQEAVNAAPDNQGQRRFVIRIKDGIYEEIVRVPLEKKNVVFLGDGMGKTVITGSLTASQPGISTYNTATVALVVTQKQAITCSYQLNGKRESV